MDTKAGGDRVAAHTAESYTVLAGRADAGLVLLCDHASNAMPGRYRSLGLSQQQLERHIAYDIGAAAVTEQIAAALDVPAVLTRYSRLLIDPNRGEDDPTLIMRLSDGAIVPGNRHLDDDEREHRIIHYYRPYHRAIADVIDRCLATGVAPALLAIHSFTESWKGVSRPWAASILWAHDARLARPLLDALWSEPGLIIGENEPYPGQYEGDTLWQHATQRGLPQAIVELRQDLIRDCAGQAAWAARLSEILRRLTSIGELEARLPPHSASGAAACAAIRPYIPACRSAHVEETTMRTFDDQTRTELEAAAFRKLVSHLRERTDVQNIDLMNLAGFCRNCLSNWYQEAAETEGEALTKDEAREIIYGMPYNEWREKYQTPASADQQAAFERNKPQH